MIKRLRRKFILINMLLVALVLLAVFGSVCFSTYKNLTSESYSILRGLLYRSADMAPPKLELPSMDKGRQRPPDASFSPVPIFIVTLDESGAVTSLEGRNVEVSDELAAAAAEQALASGRDEGSLGGLRLRFLVDRSPEGIRIAFADQTNERSSILHLLLTSLLVGLFGLTAFFFISLFLSRWALRPVEKSWNQQRQFVANASHELKTPLTVILANTGILLRHRQDTVERQLKWVENTREEGERMKKLVDDLLFLAKSDASRGSIPHTAVNLSDAAWSGLLPFESVAFEQGVTIASDIAPDITVSGDAGQLKQLIVILLDNACKYAGEKGRVSFRLERVQDRARLTVNNTGAPIPPEHQEHIFERFYRVDEARAQAPADPAGPREAGGYGLGLAIARSIAEAHRGRISVESTADAGTTFTVLLPVKG